MHKPDMEMWEEINKGLNTEDKKKSYIATFWVPIIALSAAIGGYVLGFHQNENFIGQVLSNNSIKYDTIYIYDTLVRNQYVSNTIEIDDIKSNYEKKLSLYKNKIFHLQSLVDSKEKEIVGLRIENNSIHNYFYNKTELENIYEPQMLALEATNLINYSLSRKPYTYNNQNITKLTIPNLTYFSNSDLVDFPLVKFDDSIDKKQQRRDLNRYVLNSVLPNNYKFGATYVGFDNTFSDNFNNISELELGLILGMEFSQNVSLVTGLNYRHANTKSKELTIGMIYPHPAEYSAEDEFHEIYTDSKYIDIPFLIKYKLGSNKIIQPYLKGGLHITKVLDQEFKFEVVHENEESFFYSYGGSTPFKSNTYSVAFGLEYDPVPSISTFVDLRYRSQFSNDANDYDRVNKIGVQFGLLYNW